MASTWSEQLRVFPSRPFQGLLGGRCKGTCTSIAEQVDFSYDAETYTER